MSGPNVRHSDAQAWLVSGFPAAVANLRFVLNACAKRTPLGKVLVYDRDRAKLELPPCWG
jgi:hypothetical protein